ncbi:uncharacterized protein LOC142558589 isoform X3 [Dermacentor variabilis]|uniref:uncharacterized protein LOC142558589 isoform X3 n=1 Tax=Dermacentor variabilis TaxID=34621 RepID=UPI003F5B813B
MVVGPLVSEVCFTFVLAAVLLHRYGNFSQHPLLVTVSVFVAWYFSFTIIFILPLDVSTTIASLLLIPVGHQEPNQPFPILDAHVLQNDTFSSFPFLPFAEGDPSSSTSSGRTFLKPSSMAPHLTRSIKAGDDPAHPKGHGSRACTQMAHLLVFFMQTIASLLLIPAGHQEPNQPFVILDAHVLQNDTFSSFPFLPFAEGDPLSSTSSGRTFLKPSSTAPHLTRSIKASDNPAHPKGHGSRACMQMAHPLVFFVQVRRRFGKCFRSSERYLVVLPCPTVLLDSLYDMVYLAKLLLLAGDVETNPGPDLSGLAEQLTQIAADIKTIKEERLTSIDKKLERLSGLEDNVSACTKQIASLQKTVSSLELRLDDLENRSRRSNPIVYGMQEDTKENTESLERAVNEKVIRHTLKLEPVAIERIHRLGKPMANKTRPIIFKLLDFRDKTKILRNCQKLKDTVYAISEDFSPRVRDIRKKLWQYGKARKESGDKVALVYDKLKINSCLYSWDEKNNEVTSITSTSSDTKNQDVGTRTLRPRRPQHPK